MLLTFLRHLTAKLDEESPGWEAETVILLDGARYHTGEEIREYLRKMQLQVIWSAPYSYSTAPIELLFGGLKFGELNPQRQPTGKKVSAPAMIASVNIIKDDFVVPLCSKISLCAVVTAEYLIP